MFVTKGLWFLRDLIRQIWARVALYSILAIVSAGIAPLIAPFLPEGLDTLIGRGPTLQLLSILTDSMLVVATFSLSVMVAAHQFAASQATPRSHRLLREDGRTQRVLATFIGAFVFGLTSRIAINAQAYGGRDFPVIYGVTVLVMLAVVYSLIRWVQQLSSLGSMEKTADRVEQVTRDALEAMAKAPCLGCMPLPPYATRLERAVVAKTTGYVQHIDISGLSDCTGDEGRIDILVLPGDWIAAGDDILSVENVATEEEDLRDKIVIGGLRNFEQDPVFGLQVMSEIAQRSLSSGINDPQTAIDVIRRQSRLLDLWSNRPEGAPIRELRVRSIAAEAALYTSFDSIARDGKSLVEVQLTLQEALSRLSHHADTGIREAALRMSQRALARSDDALALQEDRDAVRAAAP